MDRDPNSHQWLAGFVIGLLIVLAFAVTLANEEIQDLRVINESLRIQVNAAKIKERAWTCSRITLDKKRGGLVRWCISKSGV